MFNSLPKLLFFLLCSRWHSLLHILFEKIVDILSSCLLVAGWPFCCQYLFHVGDISFFAYGGQHTNHIWRYFFQILLFHCLSHLWYEKRSWPSKYSKKHPTFFFVFNFFSSSRAIARIRKYWYSQLDPISTKESTVVGPTKQKLVKPASHTYKTIRGSKVEQLRFCFSPRVDPHVKEKKKISRKTFTRHFYNFHLKKKKEWYVGGFATLPPRSQQPPAQLIILSTCCKWEP